MGLDQPEQLEAFYRRLERGGQKSLSDLIRSQSIAVLNIGFEVPIIAVLEDRFKFVNDSALRRNLAVCMQYIIFLWLLERRASTELGGYVKSAPYRIVI